MANTGQSFQFKGRNECLTFVVVVTDFGRSLLGSRRKEELAGESAH